jgi:hypothetical protein
LQKLSKSFLNLYLTTMKKIFILIAGICLLAACSKSDLFPGDDFNASNSDEMNLKGLAVSSVKSCPDEICLKGTSNFDVYAPKEGRVVVDPSQMYLDIDATLTHIEGQNYLLHTTETMPPPMGPFVYRIIDWEVKISEGGAIKFLWPESWWELGAISEISVADQVLLHTGCIIHGPGVNKGSALYNGYFDGVNFYAATHFTGIQVQEPSMPVYAGIIGPAKFVFSITLSKVNCPEQ